MTMPTIFENRSIREIQCVFLHLNWGKTNTGHSLCFYLVSGIFLTQSLYKISNYLQHEEGNYSCYNGKMEIKKHL